MNSHDEIREIYVLHESSINELVQVVTNQKGGVTSRKTLPLPLRSQNRDENQRLNECKSDYLLNQYLQAVSWYNQENPTYKS